LLQAFQLTDKAQAAFEQTHTVLLTVQVVLQRLDQARPQDERMAAMSLEIGLASSSGSTPGLNSSNCFGSMKL
jgi:hypothetical protein